MEKGGARTFDDTWKAALAFFRRTYWVWFALACLFVAVVSFWKLGVPDIVAWDEARHGVNGYEMIKSRSYVMTTYQYHPDYYNLKPPLSAWGIALGYRLFGYNAFGMRFYSAMAFLVLAVTAALSVKKHHGPFAALFLLVLFGSCDMFLGLHMARSGDADSLFQLFYALSMLCTIRWLEDEKGERYLYGACLCFSLAFLTRSWHAGCIPVTMLAALLCTGRLKRFKLRSCLTGLALALGPVLLWAVARYGIDGMDFFTQMIQYDLLARSTTAIEAHGGGADYYIAYVLDDAFSRFMLLLCGVGAFAFFSQRKRLSPRYVCYLLWFVLPFALFSCVSTKMDWYIFPAVAPLLIVAAVVLDRMLTASPRSAFLSPVTLCVIVVLGMFCAQSLGKVHDCYLNNKTEGVAAFLKTLSRESDYAGMECYLDGGDWTQDQVLQAELSADLVTVHGGRGAFEGDGRSAALLLMERSEYESAPLTGDYPIVAENDDRVLVMKEGSLPK